MTRLITTPGSGPHHGREIAENARWAIENLEGQWWLEHGIADGDEAVIEWTMTWRDPESGERRLNRGTEWFRLETGRSPRSAPITTAIAATRPETCSASTSPPAATRRSPSGGRPSALAFEDGFDRQGQRRAIAAASVHRGARAAAGDDRPLGANRDRPHVDEWEAAREFPRELYNRAAELGFHRAQVPGRARRPGRRLRPRRGLGRGAGRSGASGGVGAGLGAHTGIATPPVYRFGPPTSTSATCARRSPGSKIAALGITEPGAGSDVAGIRTEARKVPAAGSSTGRRRSSPTACAPTSSSAR